MTRTNLKNAVLLHQMQVTKKVQLQVPTAVLKLTLLHQTKKAGFRIVASTMLNHKSGRYQSVPPAFIWEPFPRRVMPEANSRRVSPLFLPALFLFYQLLRPASFPFCHLFLLLSFLFLPNGCGIFRRGCRE